MKIISNLYGASVALAIIKATWKQSISYQTSLFISFFSGSIPLFGSYCLWLAIYANNPTYMTLDYSLPMMLTYIFGAFLLNQFITPFGVEWQIASDISEGKLSQYLLYPFSYINFYLAKLTGEKMLVFFLRLPLILLLLYLFSNNWSFTLGFSTGPFVLSAALAYLIYSLISISIGFLAFWFIDVTGFFYIGNTIITIFSGLLLPLDLFPQPILNILKYTPFYYIIYFPMKIFTKEVSVPEALYGCFWQAFWIFILYLVTTILFRQGLKKYESFGG